MRVSTLFFSFFSIPFFFPLSPILFLFLPFCPNLTSFLRLEEYFCSPLLGKVNEIYGGKFSSLKVKLRRKAMKYRDNKRSNSQPIETLTLQKETQEKLEC